MQSSTKYLQLLFKRLLLALLMFTLCRFIFYLLNQKYFPHAGLMDSLSGVVFDVSAICMYFAPFILFSLMYFAIGKFKFYHFVNNFLFHVSSVLTISMNALDFEFFKFTSKRSTCDFFTMMSYGNDAENLIPSMIKKYWFIVIIGLSLIILSFYLYKKTRKFQKALVNPGYKKGIIYFILSAILVFGGARMSFGIKPLNLNHASAYATPENIPLVLNTPFSMIKTIEEQSLRQEKYMSDKEALKYYNPVTTYAGNDSLAAKPNVIIFLMESFSNEYIGFLSGKKTYAPFLDSLMRQSTVFVNGFANGKRSIEATPTVTASLPSLMESAYISSSFANNKLSSVASKLKEMGYNTGFFHGATNGSMGFDIFAKSHGYDNYYGRSEFGNDKFHDGTWGIYDEEFFQYWIKILDKEKEPFLSTHFTLTAHSPYPLPERYKKVFTGGPTLMHDSQRYADMALRKFFQVAKTKSWFKNTLFIFVADHSSDSNTEEFQNAYGRYKIPFIIYNCKQLPIGKRYEIAQQTDIMPTVLDLTGYKGKSLGYGKSVLRKGYRFAVQYVNGVYQMIDSIHVLQFDGKKLMTMYDRIKDPLCKTNILEKNQKIANEKVKYLEAYLQDYFYRMQFNKLTEGE